MFQLQEVAKRAVIIPLAARKQFLERILDYIAKKINIEIQRTITESNQMLQAVDIPRTSRAKPKFTLGYLLQE